VGSSVRGWPRRPARRWAALARGATAAALRQHGWRLRLGDALVGGPATVVEAAADLGPQDLVVIAVKGQALPALAPSLMPLLGPDTVVLPAMNGVPWWFSGGVPGLDAAPLQSVDPAAASRRPYRRGTSWAAWCTPAPSRPNPAWCSTRWVMV
jgi:2-dehydropantoate 2-reductase